MKTIKDLLTAFVLTSFLFACDKSNEIKYTVKGRLMHACGVPAANVTDVLFKQHGQPLFGQKGMFLSFNTDAEGYFEVVYNRKDANSLDMEILKNGPILEGIPAMKNLDLGEVFWGGMPVSFVLRLDVINPYTVIDTLVVPDFNASSPFAKIHLPGPFNDTILDTIVDFSYIGNIKYNTNPKMMFISWLTNSSNNPYETSLSIPDFCTEQLYEVVFKIE